MKAIKQIVKGSYHQVKSVYESIQLYYTSLSESHKFEETWEEVEKYIMFIGYPRSGHSLVGSLLDAHKNAIIAHELDALELVKSGYNREQIYYLLMKNSQDFTATGREWEGYTYQVPNQWQGRFDKLTIIGDKKGAFSTEALGKNPSLLIKVQQKVKVPIKFIHVIRNPYDNITTIYKRHVISMKSDLERTIDYYFSLCETIKALKQSQIKEDDMFDVRHEEFVEYPQKGLQEICRFLGIESNDGYLEDCARIVFKSPRKTRQDGPWTKESLDRVQQKIEEFPFLSGYTYEN